MTTPTDPTIESPRATARFLSTRGVSWLVTVPAPTVAELLDRAALVEEKLLARGWQPAEDRPQARSAATQASADAPVCPTHNKPMKQGQRGWYCPTKIADDGGNGKPVYCRHTVK